MAYVTVWRFDSPGGAAGALTRLQTLEVEGLLEIADACMVEWAEEQSSPRTTPFRQAGLRKLVGAPASRRLFGALTSSRGQPDVPGLDAALIERFQASVTPGSSALCIVAENTDREALARTLGSGLRHATLLETTLTADDEARVRALLADAEQP